MRLSSSWVVPLCLDDLWQLFTYMFLHDVTDFPYFVQSLASGRWGELENYWVEEVSAIFFHLWGWSGNHNTAMYHALYPPLPDDSVIGASGAIYGLLLAFGWHFPNRAHLHLFPLSHPSKIFRNYLRVLGVHLFFKGRGGGISHITHLGGLLFGLIYMAYPVIRQKIRREYYKKKWSQKGPGDKGYYH